jgi:hypothetical protein
LKCRAVYGAVKPPACDGCERVDAFHVRRSDRCSCFHLDRDTATATILEHDVHLATGVRSEMVDAWPLLTPTDLFHDLACDERLEQRTQSFRTLQQCFDVCVNEV